MRSLLCLVRSELPMFALGVLTGAILVGAAARQSELSQRRHHPRTTSAATSTVIRPAGERREGPVHSTMGTRKVVESEGPHGTPDEPRGGDVLLTTYE